MKKDSVIRIGTRGSALALAQTNLVAQDCRQAFPNRQFELKIIKTTGDEASAEVARVGTSLDKGLFTKELEKALLDNEIDLAVHSLKDLPTDLPEGLELGAVPKRVDVRDVLIYRSAARLKHSEPPSTATDWQPGQPQKRGFDRGLTLRALPAGARIGTGSTRRAAQIQAVQSGLEIAPIRGNVGTRLRKLAELAELDAIVLAAAGLGRLHFQIAPDGFLRIKPGAQTPPEKALPPGLLASLLELDEMLPCVGQGALGIEIRSQNESAREICQKLTHFNSLQCVRAERSFLREMGGGCQSPVAAYARILGHEIHMQAASFLGESAKRTEGRALPNHAEDLGRELALKLKSVRTKT